MIAKPQMKSSIAVSSVNRDYRLINIDADPALVGNFSSFGSVYVPRGPLYEDDGEFMLFVDARYDFDEVLEYIRALALEPTELVQSTEVESVPEEGESHG